MENDIQLIAVDLDGTLLNSKHELSEKNALAIEQVTAKGVKVVIATGKSRHSASAIIEKFNLDTPGIYTQGILTYNGDGTLRHQQTMDVDSARQVISFAEDRGFDALIYSNDKILARKNDPKAEELQTYGEPLPEAVGPLQNILHTIPIHKIILFGKESGINALRWQLKAQLNGQITLTRAQVEGMLEVLPANASKGKALQRLLKEMNIDPKHVLAIGDGENDSEMLETAGVSVAIGNAVESLKKIADHEVASNDKDGVAEAIEKYVLGEPIKMPEKAVETPIKAKSETKSEDTAS